MKLNEQQREEFAKAVQPAMAFLCSKFHPHMHIIIDSTRAELSESVCAVVGRPTETVEPVKMEVNPSLTKYGPNLNWFLSELANAEVEHFETGEMEVVGEGGSCDVLVTELAGVALARIEELEALLANANP